MRKVGEVENREVPVLKTGKGYKLSKTPIVAVTEEELRQMSAYGLVWPWQDFREAGLCHRAPVTLRHG